MPDGQHLAHLVEALLLERRVAHREHFVDDEDARLEERRDRESDAHLHAARIELHLPLDRVLDLRELDDLVELLGHLLAGEPEERRVDEHVLAPGEIGMNPRHHLEQRTDAAVGLDGPGVREHDAGDDLEQGRLPRTVGTDDRQALAGLDIEGDVTKDPAPGVGSVRSPEPGGAGEMVSQQSSAAVAPEPLPDLIDMNAAVRRHRRIRFRVA